MEFLKKKENHWIQDIMIITTVLKSWVPKEQSYSVKTSHLRYFSSVKPPHSLKLTT